MCSVIARLDTTGLAPWRFTIDGANLEGKTANVNVGRNFKINTRVDEEKYSKGSMNLGVGVGGPTEEGATAQDIYNNVVDATTLKPNIQVDLVPDAQFYEGTERNISQSGIRGRNSINANVGGNTNLKGGYIVSDRQNGVNLTTKTLTTSKVDSESDYHGTDGVFENNRRYSAAFSTVSSGNINVKNGDVSSYLKRKEESMFQDTNYSDDERTTDIANKYRNRFKNKLNQQSENRGGLISSVNEKLDSSLNEVSSFKEIQPNVTTKANIEGLTKYYGSVEKIPFKSKLSLARKEKGYIRSNITEDELNKIFYSLQPE